MSFLPLYVVDAQQDFHMRIDAHGSAYAHHPHEPHGSATAWPSLLPILQFAQTGGCCTSTICQEVVMTSMMIIMDTMMIIMDKYDHHHGHNDDDHHGHDDHGGVDTKSLVEFRMSHIGSGGNVSENFQHF